MVNVKGNEAFRDMVRAWKILVSCASFLFGWIALPLMAVLDEGVDSFYRQIARDLTNGNHGLLIMFTIGGLCFGVLGFAFVRAYEWKKCPQGYDCSPLW
jgi:hypothetical protein